MTTDPIPPPAVREVPKPVELPLWRLADADLDRLVPGLDQAARLCADIATPEAEDLRYCAASARIERRRRRRDRAVADARALLASVGGGTA
ncbi:hypothetical protein SAMN05216215_1013107 [Saccharopolyspora shandongensis]|uniref:Uncharacterized protein n=1 Tax=Saccharopolyspora shandongensis TaxID=418495 RepID=A0A1H3DH65_9PSEU|nr:hypothetical protein [Saccharopolyspora shandongensis]SDX65711.1 hypothetical protein SAMN05216215_1013107 [Saccharopolyspora shandongensis]